MYNLKEEGEIPEAPLICMIIGLTCAKAGGFLVNAAGVFFRCACALCLASQFLCCAFEL